ncbi:MAG TPA: hypothetical protein VFP54_05050 [Acidimicrobiales bacterium]|nr:hypothetical protein [Acidimicrobiales bacterium]
MLLCPVNVSASDPATVERVAGAAGAAVVDRHSDPWHNRTVLTVGGPDAESAVRDLARAAVAAIDITAHQGAHPRFGAVDVVPFVAVGGAPPADALTARNSFARWAGDELALPCFLYGPERSLPYVRRHAFASLAPDAGPAAPHPTAGAAAVGARPALVAYNLWLAPGTTLAAARDAARQLRGPSVRALAFDLAGRVQLSFNLVEPELVGPAEVYAAASRLVAVDAAELVGLVPRSVLRRIDPSAWARLDLDEERTVERRLGLG